MTSKIVDGSLKTDLVPRPVEYSVILPDEKDNENELPLVLNFHGGGGSRENLKRQKPLWDRLWDSNRIPPMVVAMPSVRRRCFYMDFKDGSEKWETFVLGPFLDHLRETYQATADPKRTFLTGASMGGMGSLRMAFRYPERFGAVAALEPGIEPILSWKEMRPKHRFWREDELFERAYGQPVDEEYWAENNPASMAIKLGDRIRESGLQIYLEAGDDDQFWLYEGTEFLHQILWNQKIKHEYHLVRGGDHIGPSLGERNEEALLFLARTLNPWGPPPQALEPFLKSFKEQAVALNIKDHFNE